MSNKVISSSQLANEVLKMLGTYTDEVTEGIEKCTIEVAKKGADELKRTKRPNATSFGNANQISRRDWNKYSKGWSKRDTSTKAKGFVRSTIHNKDHYQLTHLLEYGHATRNGKTTRGFAHIKPVEEKCVAEYELKVKEVIEKGGKDV